MTKITVQLILQGHPEMVEAIARRARQFLEVAEEGKDQPIALRPGMIKRVLRVVPPTPTLTLPLSGGGDKEAA